MAANTSGLSAIEISAPARIRLCPSSGSMPKRHAERCQDERELADLRQAGRHRERGVQRVAHQQHQQRGGDRLAHHDDRQHRQHAQRLVDQHPGVEQHAHRHEEQHRERVAQRQRVVRRAVAELRFAQHHAGEERTERVRHAEQLRRAPRDADRRGHHAQREQLARPGARDLPQQPREQAPPDQQHQRNEPRHLEQRDGERRPQVLRRHAARRCRAAPASGGSSTSTSTIARSSTTSQPTAMRPLADSSTPWRSSALSSTTVLATDNASPSTSAPGSVPAPPQRRAGAHRGGHGDLHDGAGQRDLAHRHQVVHREVQADAEHQQHHADLGQFAGDLHVGDEAGRARPDHDAGQQVAHQRRQLQPRRDEAEQQRQAERRGDGGDEWDRVVHAPDACRNGRPILAWISAPSGARHVQPPSNCPPSTAIVCPVTQRACGEARNSATSATSSGVPRRPNGMLFSTRSYSGSFAVLALFPHAAVELDRTGGDAVHADALAAPASRPGWRCS